MDGRDRILRIGLVEISDEKIVEMQDSRPVMLVMRADIRSTGLRYGFLARHPIIQIIFAGILIIVTGAIVIAGINLLRESHVVEAWFFLAVPFMLLGIWLLYDAVKRGHYLEIWTDKGRHRLIVGNRVKTGELGVLATELGIEKSK
jgi:hypothetical protein